MDVERISSYHIHDQVEYIRNVFESCGVTINRQSYLNCLLESTLKNFNESNTPNEIFDALYVNRIYFALLALEGFYDKNKYLKELLISTLDFMEVSQSHSKNILFELEVAGKLSRIFKDVYIAEPDIVVPFEDGDVGIACKKIISEKNLEKQLSKGVRQIKNNNFIFGIVAINIDNLLPNNCILTASTFNQALDILHSNNMSFINNNEGRFFKYLSENRIIAVLIVSSTIVDIKKETPKFNNISQSTIWTIENLKEEHQNKLNQFRILENNLT